MTFDKWLDLRDDLDGCVIDYMSAYDCGHSEGAQSRQAELDALKKRMDEVARIVHEAHMSDGNSSVEIVYELIQEVLK